MKRTKTKSTKEMDADNIILNLVTLESNDITKKKKRKSVNQNLDLVRETTNKKFKGTNTLSVPLPIKLKFDRDEPNSEDYIKLPAPIMIKNEENETALSKLDRMSNRGVEVPTNAKKGKKPLENLAGRPNSKKKNNSHSPIKSESGSESSVEDDITIKRNFSSQLNSANKKLDTDNYPCKESLLTDIKNSDDSGMSSDEKPTTEKENWIQTLQLQNPRLTKQIVNLSLPKTHAKYSLLRVPKNISPNTLLNLKCRFEKKVLNHNKQYQFQPLTKKPVPMFVNLNGPRIVNLDTVIVLEKFSPMLTLHNMKIPKRENISLPDAVKARHPLFGVNYKGKIRVEKQIKKKIIEAVERKTRLEKKKKHKVKQNSNLVADEESVLALLNLNTSKRKSRILKL